VSRDRGFFRGFPRGADRTFRRASPKDKQTPPIGKSKQFSERPIALDLDTIATKQGGLQQIAPMTIESETSVIKAIASSRGST